jgi:hypothetical protein
MIGNSSRQRSEDVGLRRGSAVQCSKMQACSSNANVRCVALLAAFAAAFLPVQAGAIDTEHLFGFTIGTDVGNVGEKEFEGSTTGRFSKATGSYRAISQTLSVEFVPAENFRAEFGGAVVSNNTNNVAGFEDRRQLAFGSFSADLRYRLLDRATAPFGLAIGAEPHWGRIDELTGAAVNQYGVDFVVAADREIVPDRVVAAFNLLYQPEATRAGLGGAWSRESTLGVAAALMLELRPGVFIGGEARYLRKYEGSGFDELAGHGVFFGPTLYVQLSRAAWIAAAWSAQIAGRSAAEPGSLDLVNFERHQARLLFGISF